MEPELKVYMVGGYGENYSYLSIAEVYDPVKFQWSQLPDMPTARGDLMCVAVAGEMYVLGGYYDGIVMLQGERIVLVGGEGHYENNSDFKYPKHVNEVYYVSDQTWVEKAMIPTARFRTAAAQAGGLAYVFGGADLCIDKAVCHAQNTTEAYLDVDHPDVYIYLKNDPYYNDNAALSLYPF